MTPKNGVTTCGIPQVVTPFLGGHFTLICLSIDENLFYSPHFIEKIQTKNLIFSLATIHDDVD